MSEETKTKHASVRLTTFILLVILVAIAFGGAGYIYGRNGVVLVDNGTVDLLTATAGTSVVPSASATVGSTFTADVTANWKTYTNEKYGFSIKYPSDWNYEEKTKTSSTDEGIKLTSPESAKKLSDCKSDASKKGMCYIFADIDVSWYRSFQDSGQYTAMESKKATTLNDWAATVSTDIAKNVTKSTNEKGVQFVEAQMQADPSYLLAATTNNSNNLVNLNFLNHQNTFSELTSTEKQILSTFQFTK